MPRPRNATPAHAAPSGGVRIVGGRWRGTRLAVADLPGLRPTADRVRETLFNWLQPVLPGARVLDLFAGSGALGLEAVSRGAAQAVLVERDAALAEALHATARRLDAGDAVHVVSADALAWLRAPLFGRFDVVFVDPPFADAPWERVLEALPPWLADAAWLYLETPVETGYAPGPAFQPHREGCTRQARYALYRHVRPAAGPATLAGAPTADGGS